MRHAEYRNLCLTRILTDKKDAVVLRDGDLYSECTLASSSPFLIPRPFCLLLFAGRVSQSGPSGREVGVQEEKKVSLAGTRPHEPPAQS